MPGDDETAVCGLLNRMCHIPAKPAEAAAPLFRRSLDRHCESSTVGNHCASSRDIVGSCVRSYWDYEGGGEGAATAGLYRFRDSGKGHRDSLTPHISNSADCYLSAHRPFLGSNGDATNRVGLRDDPGNR